MLFALSLNSFVTEAKSNLKIELFCGGDIVGVICDILASKKNYKLLIVKGIKWKTDVNVSRKNQQKYEEIIEISLKQFSSRIPSNIGLYFLNITNLIIHNSNLNQINRHDFTSMTQLKKLQIYKNQIETIETDSFHDLLNLEYMDLDENKLSVLPSELLLHSKYLRVFSAAFNSISKVSVNFFNNTKLIRKIDLRSNLLQDIDFITKSNNDFEDLAYINLKNNSQENCDKFYTIEQKFYEKLQSIENSNPKLEYLCKFTANKVENIIENLQQCNTQKESFKNSSISDDKLKKQNEADYLN